MIRDSFDFYAARKNDEDPVICVALVEKQVARLGLTLGPERPQARDLVIVQRREHRVDLFGCFGHE